MSGLTEMLAAPLSAQSANRVVDASATSDVDAAPRRAKQQSL